MSISSGLFFRRFMVVSEVGRTHAPCRFIMAFKRVKASKVLHAVTRDQAAAKLTECTLHHPSGGTRPSVMTANSLFSPHFSCQDTFQALAAWRSGQRKASPVRHMVSRITASLRATATLAFLLPFFFFNRSPQLFKGWLLRDRPNSTCAAS